MIAARSRTTIAEDAATRFLDGGGRGGAGASALGGVLPVGRVWAQANPTALAIKRPPRTAYVARVAGEGAVRDAFAEAARGRFASLGITRTEARPAADARREQLEHHRADRQRRDFYTKDQQAIIREHFRRASSAPNGTSGSTSSSTTTAGGYGVQNSIAIFGKPGSDKFEFVMTGRHMTIRCDGNTADHVAFGGPIFYGHAADGFNEGPTHPGNVFWPQAQAANKLYQMLD